MNSTLSVDLLLFSAILIAVGLYATRFSPEIGAIMSVTTFAAAALCLLWGILGLRGLRGRVGPIITLLALAAALLPLTIKRWLELRAGNTAGKPLAVLGTILFVFALVQALNIFQKRTGILEIEGPPPAKNGNQRHPKDPLDQK